MKTSILLVAVLIAGVIILQGSRNVQDGVQDAKFYPAGVKQVVDKKCYGCHSVKGQSQDAKDAVMWDSLPGLTKRELMATLDEIIEVLDEGSMPPEDVVKKYPDAKLLPKERDILKKWADAKADSLLN